MKTSVFRFTAFLFAIGLPASGTALLAQGMPEMGAPKEMEQLSYMIGTWTTDNFQFRMEPNSEFVTSSATMSVEKVLDGAILSSVFKGNFMGMDFKGIGALSYNREAGIWQNTWVDNMAAYQQYSTGKWQDGVLVLEGSDVYQGQAFKSKDVTKRISDTQLEWHMDMSYDDGKTWFTSMKATYTKQ